jgi:hypothetical protein
LTVVRQVYEKNEVLESILLLSIYCALTAQEQAVEANNGLVRTANCLLLAHKSNYTKKETFMQPPISQIL